MQIASVRFNAFLSTTLIRLWFRYEIQWAFAVKAVCRRCTRFAQHGILLRQLVELIDGIGDFRASGGDLLDVLAAVHLDVICRRRCALNQASDLIRHGRETARLLTRTPSKAVRERGMRGTAATGTSDQRFRHTLSRCRSTAKSMGLVQ